MNVTESMDSHGFAIGIDGIIKEIHRQGEQIEGKWLAARIGDTYIGNARLIFLFE